MRAGSMGKHIKLKFQEKLKIAIDIARGLRYMHEECPQGPIIHGNLLITNIFLRNDLRPMVISINRNYINLFTRVDVFVIDHQCALL